jgi:hypothetical protein
VPFLDRERFDIPRQVPGDLLSINERMISSPVRLKIIPRKTPYGKSL